MKKTWKFCYQSVIFAVAVICMATTAFASSGEKTAVPTWNKFMMDGKSITFDSAYNIKNSNYIQLRSVAIALNGTASQFNVYWDNDLGVAVIETGKPYTGLKPVEVQKQSNYKLGDTFVTDNCEISVTDYAQYTLGDGGYQNTITVDILLKTNAEPKKTSVFGKFIDCVVDENGEVYKGFWHDGISEVYSNERQSYTAIYSTDRQVDFTSITVVDPISKEKVTFYL